MEQFLDLPPIDFPCRGHRDSLQPDNPPGQGIGFEAINQALPDRLPVQGTDYQGDNLLPAPLCSRKGKDQGLLHLFELLNFFPDFRQVDPFPGDFHHFVGTAQQLETHRAKGDGSISRDKKSLLIPRQITR